jgi:REP element-mobilizing transposase RayT
MTSNKEIHQHRQSDTPVESSTQNVEAHPTSHPRPPQFLNKKQYVQVYYNHLPHWDQEYKTQFVTFRLNDSLPQVRLKELDVIKRQWITNHPKPWSQKTSDEYNHLIRNKCDKWLDQGMGSCVLRRPDIRQVVEQAIMHYKGVRYDIYAYVIMPNHVHILLSPLDGMPISETLSRVKGYSARVINSMLETKGTLWQKDTFGRIVRDGYNFDQYINYIRANPRNLSPSDYTLNIFV